MFDEMIQHLQSTSIIYSTWCHRRIEDKLDALEIYSELVMVRMADPPGQKHVPLQFPCWVCLEEGSRQSNAFKGCQLILDRHWWGSRAMDTRLSHLFV